MTHGLAKGIVRQFLFLVIVTVAKPSVSAADVQPIVIPLALLSEPQTFQIPETSSQILWINIPDADWQTMQKWVLLDPASGSISDDVIFFNNMGANLIFRSDDELGALPLYPDNISGDLPIELTAFEPGVSNVLFLMNNKPPILVTVLSDLNPGTLISDAITVEIAPEPSTLGLGGAALLLWHAWRRRKSLHWRRAAGS